MSRRGSSYASPLYAQKSSTKNSPKSRRIDGFPAEDSHETSDVSIEGLSGQPGRESDRADVGALNGSDVIAGTQTSWRVEHVGGGSKHTAGFCGPPADERTCRRYPC